MIQPPEGNRKIPSISLENGSSGQAKKFIAALLQIFFNSEDSGHMWALIVMTHFEERSVIPATYLRNVVDHAHFHLHIWLEPTQELSLHCHSGCPRLLFLELWLWDWKEGNCFQIFLFPQLPVIEKV